MPNRILREAILTSERVAALDWASEVFYRRLHSIVDDYGRYEAGYQLLRAKCYPLQTDSVRVADIARWMAACQKSGLILVYGVNGKQYLEVSDFKQQARTASKFPQPPAKDGECLPLIANDINCNQLSANAHLGVVVSVVEDVVDIGATPPTPAILLPLNTGAEHPVLETQLPEYKALYPAVDVMGELRKMRGWLLANKANRKTAGGIERFIANWLAKEQDRARIATTAPQVNTSMGASPQKVKTPAEIETERIDGLRYMAGHGNADAIAKLQQMGIPA